MSESKSKVYIIQKVLRKHMDGTLRGLDFSQAERFGEIIYLFDSQKQVVMSPQPTIRKIKQILKDFKDRGFSDLFLISAETLVVDMCRCKHYI